MVVALTVPRNTHRLRLAAVLAAGLLPLLSACADYTPIRQKSVVELEQDQEPDPWEPFNRAMFKVHNVLDQVIVRPIASIYNGVVPEPGRKAVSNVLVNLRAPIDLTNSVLQGDVQNSFATFWKFTLNTTVGLGGIYDFAGHEGGLKTRQADFGETLALCGVPSGPYLFLPLVGPSTLRDTAGRGVDLAFDPFTYTGDEWRWLTYTKDGLILVDFRSQNMKLIDDVNRNSLDPYVTYRSGYLQHRSNELRQALESRKMKPISSPAQ